MRFNLYKIFKQTPVAWLQVTNNPVKLSIALAGIGFSNLLIFFQLGLMDSIYNSQRKPIEKLSAELVMVSSGYSNLGSLQEFDRTRLYQALGVRGVDAVTPLRIARGTWITPETRQKFDIFIYGIDLDRQSLDFPELKNNLAAIQPLGTALFDRNAKKQYGNVSLALRKNKFMNVEVNNKTLKIIDTFSLGATFSADANLITSDATFQYLFPNQDSRKIQLGLIHIKPGVSAASIQKTIQPLMAHNVRVLTRGQLAELELSYWKKNSSVGFIFSLGVLVGFVVGSIIVYQILFGDVMNSLPQYATLKAMGYKDKYVIGIVIKQSAILAFIGFIPGIILSTGLYALLAGVTKLTIFMTATRAIQVLTLTFIMCVGSGALATRKLIELDPADVF
jgi:putative ABC transport system permease protein